MEAETGVMLSQAREHLDPPEAKVRQKCFSLETLEGVWSSWPLDFGRLDPRTGRKYISVVLSHPVCGHLLEQP